MAQQLLQINYLHNVQSTYTSILYAILYAIHMFRFPFGEPLYRVNLSHKSS